MKMVLALTVLIATSADAAARNIPAPPPKTYEISSWRSTYEHGVSTLPAYRLQGVNDDLMAHTFSSAARDASTLPLGALAWTTGRPAPDRNPTLGSDARDTASASFGYDTPRSVCVVTSSGSRCGMPPSRDAAPLNGRRDTAPLDGVNPAPAGDYGHQDYGHQYVEIGAPVPEPAQWLQLLAGLTALTLVLRRQGRRQSSRAAS